MGLRWARGLGGVLLGLGCGPAVPSGEIDPASSSGDAMESSSSDSTGGDAPACPVPDRSLGPTSETEMASSMAAIFCLAVEACGCPGHRPSPSCRHADNMGWESVRDWARSQGLTYDGACLAAQQSAVMALACSTDASLDMQDVLGPGRCAVYYGTRGLGDACEARSNAASTCRQGLACLDGVCTSPCDEALGTRNNPYGFACPAAQRMTSGSNCESPAAIGEPCNSAGCEAGAYCAAIITDDWCEVDCSVCQRQFDLGSPCTEHRACLTGVCDAGQCVEAPAIGRPCLDERCGTGAMCRDGVCEPLPAICNLLPEPPWG